MSLKYGTSTYACMHCIICTALIKQRRHTVSTKTWYSRLCHHSMLVRMRIIRLLKSFESRRRDWGRLIQAMVQFPHPSGATKTSRLPVR